MAPRVTSASDRSKRKSAKPVTQGQNPQRANRQKVASKMITRSGAGAVGSPTGSGRTTYSDDRGLNKSTAKVTQGKGGGNGRPALPPGQRGGALATSTKPPAARPQLPGAKPPARLPGGTGGADRVRGSGVRTGQPGAARPALPAAKPPTAAAPKPSTPRFSMAGAGRLLGGALSAAGSTQMLLGGSSMLSDQLERSGITKAPKGSKTLAEREKASAKSKPTDRSSLRYEKLFDTKGGRGNYGLDKPTPVAPLPTAVTRTSSGGSGGSSPRSGGSSPRSSAPARSSAPSAPAKPGQKFADFNPNRGTSRTNNPLMKDFVARMKDREDKAQASSASKLTNKFNTKDNYSGEKVDGSKVDTKAKISPTTSEYDKKKRRYGG